MKAIKFCKILEDAINETRREHGIDEKVGIVPCDVVQICSNGRHKDVETGRFTN